MTTGRGLIWLDVKDAPQDGSEILLNHRTHGIIQGLFSKGEWSDDTPISPREYSGDMWILGDGLQQDEVEFGEHGEVVASGVIGWIPLNALSTTLAADADRVRIAVEALEPFARLELPKKSVGNAGAYSLLHTDIRRAAEAVAALKSTAAKDE